MLDRREFLKAGLIGGGALAASSVAAAPAAVPEAPIRLNRMSVTYIPLPIGVEKPFTVFHISDTHLKALAPSDPERLRKFLSGRFVDFDNESALATSLEWARRRKCDYILHTGDLIDCATDGNVARLKDILAGVDNLLYAPGNHEFATTNAGPAAGQTEADFRAMNTAKVQAAAPFDLSFSTRVLNGVNMVMMDDVYGTISRSSIERFHAEAKKGLPIVLCMHVPLFSHEMALAHARSHMTYLPLDEQPVPVPSRDFRRQSEDRDTADFIRYLKSEPLLKAILAGHYHCGISSRFSPTAMQYVVGGNFRYCGQEIVIF